MRITWPIVFALLAGPLVLGTGCKKLLKRGEEDPKPKAATTTTATSTGISGAQIGTAPGTATATGTAASTGGSIGALADIGSKPASPAKDSIWKTLTAKGEKFSVEMPGEWEEETSDLNVSTFKVKQHRYSVKRKQAVFYMFSWQDFPIVPANPKAALEAGRDGMLRSMGGTISEDKEVKLAGKYPGRDVHFDISKPILTAVSARMYMVGKRLYQMVVAVPSIASEPKENITKFLDSLKP